MLSPHNHSSQLIFAHSTDEISFIICSWVAPCHGMKRADHPWFALMPFARMSSFLCWWAWTHSSMDGHSSPGGIMEPMRGWLIGDWCLIIVFPWFSLKILWIAIGNPWFLIELFHVEPHDVSLKIISIDDAHQWASSISFLMDAVIFSSFSISCKVMYSNCSHPLMPQWFHIGSIIEWFFPHSHRFHKLSLCW